MDPTTPAFDASAAVCLRPVGVVRAARQAPLDDHWDSELSEIVIDAGRFTPASLQGLEAFSHIEVVYVFHCVAADVEPAECRHPRGRTDWPMVGIFAQRAKDRPNRLGVSVCQLVAVKGLHLRVQGLDAIDGTPVLDIKPVLREFLPRGPQRQPSWATQLMADYW